MGCWERSLGTPNRVKIGPGTLLGHPVAPKSVPKASQERLGSVSGRPGAPLGTLRAYRGRPEMLPRRSRNAFGTLLGATGCPKRVPVPILARFWMLQGVPGTGFGWIFTSLPLNVFKTVESDVAPAL